MATLIITEKPSSAEKIAKSLAEGKIERKANLGVSYFLLTRKGKEIIVAPAVGHLFVLGEKNPEGWKYPVFDVEWKPLYLNKKSSWSKKYFQNLASLSKKADSFISACDYDIEGSVIAWNIIKFICKAKDGKRMKFSTLTNEDLVEAYETASPHLDFGHIDAGLARHHLDFFWGINVSRALTLSLKAGGGFRVLSTGRVQGPTLKILMEREKEIGAFVPTPFHELWLESQLNGQKIELIHEKGKFPKRPEAEKALKKCKGKNGDVESVEKRQYKQNPPFPFDLTTLQRESFLHFGYSPKQTLDIAQTLYEMGAISYPRTASQKLPAKLGFKRILESFSRMNEYKIPASRLLAKKTLKANEGKKDDPAHPSIFPTAETPETSKLNSYQKKLYDLIARRFIAVFGDPAVREAAKIIVSIEGEKFIAEGARTIKPNWIEFYPYAKFKEAPLPEAKKGDHVRNLGLEIMDKETQPPSRFSQATVLKKLEDLGLGTKATRAQILQTLYDRGYIEGKSITVTKLGEAVVNSLEKYSPEIISIDLTRKFESEMEGIQEGKLSWEKIVAEAESSLKKTLSRFKKNEEKIGSDLREGMKEFLRKESEIGPCLKCGNILVIRRSRIGKRFVGCTGYPKCTETYSLPGKGQLTTTEEKCSCGLFIILVRTGKRPWKLCVKDGYVKKIPVAQGPANP